MREHARASHAPVAGDLLRANGLSVTAQRLAVLDAVDELPHATTDELIEQVRASIGTVSRQSVYDTLNAFVAKRLVRRIQLAGSVARYERHCGDNHHHVVCRSCGAVADVDHSISAAPLVRARDAHGFEIDEAEVVYWGHCPTCQAAH